MSVWLATIAIAIFPIRVSAAVAAELAAVVRPPEAPVVRLAERLPADAINPHGRKLTILRA